jgi:hypothetical protein
MNPFIKQGVALPKVVRDKIIDCLLQGQDPVQIGLSLNVKRQTVSNVIDDFTNSNIDDFSSTKSKCSTSFGPAQLKRQLASVSEG